MIERVTDIGESLADAPIEAAARQQFDRVGCEQHVAPATFWGRGVEGDSDAPLKDGTHKRVRLIAADWDGHAKHAAGALGELAELDAGGGRVLRRAWARLQCSPMALNGGEHCDVGASNERANGDEEVTRATRHVLVSRAPDIRVLDNHDKPSCLGSGEVGEGDEPSVRAALPAALFDQGSEITPELGGDISTEPVQ